MTGLTHADALKRLYGDTHTLGKAGEVPTLRMLPHERVFRKKVCRDCPAADEGCTQTPLDGGTCPMRPGFQVPAWEAV